jgi:hypothetical protein
MWIKMFRCFTNHSQSLNFMKVNVEKKKIVLNIANDLDNG